MTDSLDPKTLVISRRRKKYKFALFANSPICYELNEWKKRKVNVVELGAGTALFAVELATRHPDKTFVAVDVKADRLQKGAREAEDRKLKNIWFVRCRANQLYYVVPKHSLETLWLTFPDPFPRDRSANRRMTHPQFLGMYKELLRPDGSLLLKHDNREFFEWSRKQLVSEKWKIVEESIDLHESDLSSDYKIRTTYENKWLGEGLATNFVHAKR